MTALEKQNAPATANEVRAIIGPCDDEIVAGVVATGATRDEVLEALAWLASDDYLHRKLHHSLSGRAADVFDVLEARWPEENRR